MAKLDYEILDHGSEHGQYFQGCGVSFTRYTHVVTGVGDTPREALEDALEGLYQTIDDAKSLETEDLDKEVQELQASTLADLDAHALCECEHGVVGGCAECQDEDKWHDDCEIHYYVSIRWRVAPEAVQSQA